MGDRNILYAITPTKADGPQRLGKLRRLLTSADAAMFDCLDAVEVVIVGDTHDGPLPDVAKLCEEFGATYIDVDAGHHCWGHCQINYALAYVAGKHAMTPDVTAWACFNDDDDVYTRTAFTTIHRSLPQDPSGPLFFQWQSYSSGKLPIVADDGGFVIREGLIGGHSIVVPVVPGKLGTWGCRYEGDYDFIASTLALFPEWRPFLTQEVIAVARPAR